MRIFLIILFITPISLFALNEAVDNTSIYNKGLGGPHSSMVRGFDSFFNNPALLSEYESETSFFSLDVNLKGDALDVINLYLGDDFSLDDPAVLISTLEDKGLTSLLIGIDLPGPLYIGHIGNNWGWALRNSTDVFVELPSLLSNADIIAREDMMFSSGISFPFKFDIGKVAFLKFSPGVMARATLRGEMHIDSDLLGLMGYVDDYEALLDVYPLYLSPMFALDAGFLFNFSDIVSLSGVVKDIYTPILKYPVTTIDDAADILSTDEDTTGNLVYREINFGLSVDIPLGPLSVVVSDLDFYFDYFDLLELEKNTLLHLGAGLDVELLEKFHLLAGMNEGLLSLGLNVDLGGFDIGFVMYGTEESSEPGLRSTFNFLFSVGISF